MFEKRDKLDCWFIFIYFIEQIALVLLYTFSSKWLGLWIGLFPVIFLTTIALEKSFLKVDFKDQMRDLENKLKEKGSETKRYKEFNTTKDLFIRNKLFHGDGK